METGHRIQFDDARELKGVAPGSVDLVLTSPPYPMIAMWDELFAALAPRVGGLLAAQDGSAAWETMHGELDRVWAKSVAALRPGGLMIVNIGDATRTIDGSFRLFSNHARVIQKCLALGLSVLPPILWRKQTNAPNKFMGSGMLPPGAYVTLEHEHLLIFRKGAKREFTSAAAKLNRRRSALFWEERNEWFSDLWVDLKGIRQNVAAEATRGRSAAFPFELAYRLVNMFSVRGDLVLDPFLGTGTTMLAAVAAGRHSLGFELDPGMGPIIQELLLAARLSFNETAARRLDRHRAFAAEREAAGRPLKHRNACYDFPVMTAQESDLELGEVERIEIEGSGYRARFRPHGERIAVNQPGPGRPPENRE